MKNKYLYASVKSPPPVHKKRINISIDRMQKITKKIESSIDTQDITKFNKWNEIIKKENARTKFKMFFENALRKTINLPDDMFFDFLLYKTISLISTTEINKLISTSINNNLISKYEIIKKVLAEDFYNYDCFKSNPLSRWYRESFNHDFKKVLELTSYEKIRFFCDELHINKINSIDMTNELFKQLKPEDREKSYLINLTKSLQNNHLVDIEYFFFALTNEFELSLENREILIKQGLKEKVINFPGTLGSIMNSLNPASLGILMPTEIKLNSAGEFFKSLLEKHDLKIKLEQMPTEKMKSTKKIKI